jgi:gliding-associated putative ABC transporter substrate-binding component GldG
MSGTNISSEVQQVRRTRQINLVLLAGILILINLLGTNQFIRWDMTGRGIYSLSSASKTVIRDLEDQLTIKAFFSEDLPSQYASNARFVKDKLDDYKAYGRRKVHFEFMDPGSEEDLQQEASQYGIQPATVRVVERDRLELKQIYMALVFLYQDRTETIPLVQSTAGLEYDITTAIRRVSRTELPVVGFLSGHGMATPDDQLSNWRQPLERHYQVRTISLDGYESVPPDVEALFVVGPTEGLNQWERYAVDQFLMRGGKSAWLLDMVDADLQQSQERMAQPLELGMDAWLAYYVIRVRPALVMDRLNQEIMVTQRQGFFQVQRNMPYPFFPIVRNLDTENPMVKDLPGFTLFYASPIDTVIARPDSTAIAGTDTIHAWPAAPPDVRIEPVAFSSEVSSLQEGFFFIQPNPAFAASNFSGGPYPLAATVTGNLSSAFEGAPVVPDTVTVPAQIYGPVENRLVVVGDATFAKNDYVGVEGNAALLLNMVDWLFQDEALIGIRAKEVDYRPLAEISNAGRIIIKWLNILLPPALAIFAGLMWWRYRRRPRRQQLLESSTGEA